MKATNQQERIFARVTPEVRATLRQAAETTGTTLNQFLVQSVLKEAHAIIEREQIIRLTQRDAELFFAVLENPPAPSEKLREAVTAYRSAGFNVQLPDAAITKGHLQAIGVFTPVTGPGDRKFGRRVVTRHGGQSWQLQQPIPFPGLRDGCLDRFLNLDAISS